MISEVENPKYCINMLFQPFIPNSFEGTNQQQYQLMLLKLPEVLQTILFVQHESFLCLLFKDLEIQSALNASNGKC